MTDHKALIDRLRVFDDPRTDPLYKGMSAAERDAVMGLSKICNEAADALSAAAEALEGAESRVKAAEAEATVLHVALAEAREVVEFVAKSPYRGSRETVTPESAWPAYLRLHDIYMDLCERAQHWLAAQGASDDK